MLATVGAVLVSMITTLGLAGSTAGPASAAGVPSSPTDSSKVPHYFGPWANWANSPFTTSNAVACCL